MLKLTFAIILMNGTFLCYSQKKIVCDSPSLFTGTLRLIKEKDAVWGNEKLTYYLFFDHPTSIFESSVGSESDTPYITSKTILFLPVFYLNLEKYINKKVVVNGTIQFPGTMHYNTETAIFDITDISLKGKSTVAERGLYLGQIYNPPYQEFEIISIAKETNIYTYKYRGSTPQSIFNRRIGDFMIRLKGNQIITIIYDLIPGKPRDKDVAESILDAVQSSLSFPLAYSKGVYGVNIDSASISISRTNNPMTLNQDRIMYFTSIKGSILKQ